MNIKELKKGIDKIPDDYEIRTRSTNSNLHNDESITDVSFYGIISKVKPVHSQKILMLIRGFE